MKTISCPALSICTDRSARAFRKSTCGGAISRSSRLEGETSKNSNLDGSHECDVDPDVALRNHPAGDPRVSRRWASVAAAIGMCLAPSRSFARAD
jgi:hypothetical protein